jgi:hypothetical protein
MEDRMDGSKNKEQTTLSGCRHFDYKQRCPSALNAVSYVDALTDLVA